MASITCDGQLIKIDGMAVEDPGLAELLRAQPEERWEEITERALAVGARGLLTMGLGIDLTEVDARVRRTVEEVTAEAQQQVESVLDTARRAFSEQFDPEHRSSMVARALGEFASWRDRFLQGVDPGYADSHTARFLEELEELLGPHGVLETRLRDVLDPDADGSALARVSRSIESRITELRDLIVEGRGRAEEAERGTAKGYAFEEVVEEHLRDFALGLGGCVVERTSTVPGDLSGDATVGDFVVALPTGQRILVEAKNVARINLAGKEGILAELDRGMANRNASLAVCVSARPAFPKEVGCFGVYGNRLLVVDDGEGTVLEVALRMAATLLASSGMERGVTLDTKLVFDRLDRLRELAQLFSSNRRTLTEVTGSITQVQESLGGMRSELLAHVDELSAEVERAFREASEADDLS